MEESDNTALEFCSTANVDCRWTKGFPNDGLTDIGGNKQRDTRAKTVTFLQQFIEQENDETGNEQLNDNQKTNTGTNLRWHTVHAGHDIDNGLSDSNDHTKEFLCSVEESTVLRAITDLDDFCTGQQLHDQTWGDDGWDT